MKKNLIFFLLVVLLLSITSQVIALENNSMKINENSALESIATVFDKSTDYFKKVVSEFTDMGKHWADIAVGKLVELGAIGGYGDGSFKPDKNITRAEFSKILNKTLKLEEFKGSAFEDTYNHWAKDDIYTLVQHNIIKKEEYGANYTPDKNITRIEITKMLVRAMGLGKQAEELSHKNTSFIDNKTIDLKDRGYVLVAVEQGFIGGYPDNTFKPLKEATRGEATSMVVRMLEAMMKQPPKQEEVKGLIGEKKGVVEKETLNGVTFQISNVKLIDTQRKDKDGNPILKVSYDFYIKNNSKENFIFTTDNMTTKVKFSPEIAHRRTDIEKLKLYENIRSGESYSTNMYFEFIRPINSKSKAIYGSELVLIELDHYDKPRTSGDRWTTENKESHCLRFFKLEKALYELYPYEIDRSKEEEVIFTTSGSEGKYIRYYKGDSLMKVGRLVLYNKSNSKIDYVISTGLNLDKEYYTAKYEEVSLYIDGERVASEQRQFMDIKDYYYTSMAFEGTWHKGRKAKEVIIDFCDGQFTMDITDYFNKYIGYFDNVDV